MVGVQYSSAGELKVNQNKHQMDPLDIKEEPLEGYQVAKSYKMNQNTA